MKKFLIILPSLLLLSLLISCAPQQSQGLLAGDSVTYASKLGTDTVTVTINEITAEHATFSVSSTWKALVIDPQTGLPFPYQIPDGTYTIKANNENTNRYIDIIWIPNYGADENRRHNIWVMWAPNQQSLEVIDYNNSLSLRP